MRRQTGERNTILICQNAVHIANGGDRVREFRKDTRAVAEGLSYILAFGLMAVFVFGVMAQGAGIFEDATENAQLDSMEFEVERVAGAVEETDRAVRSTQSEGEVSTVVDLPEKIGGDQYYIEFENTPSGGAVQINLTGSDQSARTQFQSDTPIQEDRLQGGPIRIVRKEGETSLTVEEEE
jgi:hypothetical protein